MDVADRWAILLETGGRRSQQDYVRVTQLDDEGSILAVVADGMGGHLYGDVAAKIVCDSFTENFLQSHPANSVDLALGGALEFSNNQIQVWRNRELANIVAGTTCLAVFLHGDKLYWISVGDSPLWGWDGSSLRRLNEDHSFRSQDLADGVRNKNVLRSAVTGEKIALIDRSEVQIDDFNNGLILLASDGVLTLSETELSRCLSDQTTSKPDQIAAALAKIIESKKKKNQDNYTIVILKTNISQLNQEKVE